MESDAGRDTRASLFHASIGLLEYWIFSRRDLFPVHTCEDDERDFIKIIFDVESDIKLWL